MKTTPPVPAVPTLAPSAPSFKPFARPRKKPRRTEKPRPHVFNVKSNPSHYVFDFEPSAQTPERLISNLVLAAHSDDTHAVVNVVSMPGAGKTVAVRAVAHHPSILSVFVDGVYLYQSGPETQVSSLFSDLGGIVAKLCGPKTAADMAAMLQTSTTFQTTIQILYECLKEKHFLLILDNVSEEAGAIFEVLSALVATVAQNPSSFTVVSTTRSIDISRKFGSDYVLHLQGREPLGKGSKDILCTHAGFDPVTFAALCEKKDKSAVCVLQKCAGLPLALAVAGGAVRRLTQSAQTESARKAIWSQYWAYLAHNFAQFGEISGLFNAIKSCVLSIKKGANWKSVLPVSEVINSLSVFKSGEWVPYQVLQRLWSLKKTADVAPIVNALLNRCLVTRIEKDKEVGILIPEIVLDFSKKEAAAKGGNRKWHVKLLSTYIDQLPVEHMPDGKKRKAWWLSHFPNDEYLQRNLGFHLRVCATPDKTGKTAKVASNNTEKKSAS